MPKRLNILQALGDGLVTTYKLADEDCYVIAVVAKDKKFVIPCIKNDRGTNAYISLDYSADEYYALADIVEGIGKNKVYEGMYPYRPVTSDAPAHSKKVVSRMKPTSLSADVSVPQAVEFLKSLGYEFEEVKGPETAAINKDYTALLAKPENKAMFDKDAEDLEAVGATFDGLNADTKIAFSSIMQGKSYGIIFTGPTGTGKSFAARICAHEAKAPLLNLQITYGTTIEDLVGMFIPNADASKSTIEEVQSIYHSKDDVETIFKKIGEIINKPNEQGKWKFVPGKLLTAYHEGYQIVLEEINYGQPGVNAKLNEFTDGTPRVSVNGITYSRNPNFVAYMTMNPGYQGTECLNVALKNRFSIVNIPELTKSQFCKRIMAYSKKTYGYQLKKSFFEKLFEFGGIIEKESKTSKWRENVKFSIRNAQRLCDCILTKAVSYDEFASAMAIQYVNVLNCDNDNSSKLEAYKESEAVAGKIKELYSLYDFAASKTVEVTATFDSFFVEDDTILGETADASKKTKAVGDILSRFGSK